MRRTLPLLLVLLLTLLGAPAGAQTPAAPGGVGLVPAPGSRFASTSGTFLELGEVVRDREVTGEVLLRNAGREPRQVRLYASDALPAQGGGFGFSDRDAADTQVGRWLSLRPETVTVPPTGEARATFRVRVPAGTEGGEYVGGVVAEPVAEAGGSGVLTATRVAMAVYLTLPGGARGATPGRGAPGGRLAVEGGRAGADGDRLCPVVSYRNDSQKVLDPTLSVEADGLLGDASYTRTRTGAVLPGTAAEVRLPCVDRPLGPSTLRVQLRADGVLTDYEATDLYLPAPLLLALLLLVLLVLAVVMTALRGRYGHAEQGRTPRE